MLPFTLQNEQNLRKMIATKTTFQILDLPTRQLAFVGHVGPYQGDTALFQRLFGTVSTWLQTNNLLSSESECISLYHDDPETVPVDKQRISVGFTVPVGTRLRVIVDERRGKIH